MNTKEQVTSFALSKKLKAAGVTQKSIFWYGANRNTIFYRPKGTTPSMMRKGYSAFTSSELLDMIPEFLRIGDSLTYKDDFRLEQWRTISEYQEKFKVRTKDGDVEKDVILGTKPHRRYMCCYVHVKDPTRIRRIPKGGEEIAAPTEVEMRGKLLLWLIQNDYQINVYDSQINPPLVELPCESSIEELKQIEA